VDRPLLLVGLSDGTGNSVLATFPIPV